MVIDTDIIVRFLTNDDQIKAKRFKKFLLSGTKFTLTDVTAAEIFWTLNSFYKLDKLTIVSHLEILISHSSVICNQKLLQETLNVLKVTNLSYIDAYTTAYSQINNNGQILSYDQGFDKLSGVTRVEP